ncbi:ParB N-terminal domain-containing protein [Amycolatopsis sp. NPDC051102]|uniref:ParB/RepB/Spo0J family partition protein n=1 Tax=Amycolatopsis sp. NPDC051102 TaxID=3155163 RepID=UPI003445F13B
MDSVTTDGDAADDYSAAVLGRIGEAVAEVPIASLLPADSPRAAGEDSAHVRALAESEVDLPPIVVHRPTMRVIDGMHRVRAAELRGAQTIEARFFAGTPDDAFILAVRSNIVHGLPLALADRKAAAWRILHAHREWSDRAIAALTGLAHKTVGALRRRSSGENPQSTARVGRDGRVRPISSVEGRRRASALLAKNPDSSTQEIARAAGISTTTVKDVRKRLRQGENPVPEKQRSDAIQIVRRQPVGLAQEWDRTAALRQLRADPSLRFTESGRMVLRSLDAHNGDREKWDSLADSVPQHCIGLIVELVVGCVADWQRFVDRLERRAQDWDTVAQ